MSFKKDERKESKYIFIICNISLPSSHWEFSYDLISTPLTPTPGLFLLSFPYLITLLGYFSEVYFICTVKFSILLLRKKSIDYLYSDFSRAFSLFPRLVRLSASAGITNSC